MFNTCKELASTPQIREDYEEIEEMSQWCSGTHAMLVWKPTSRWFEKPQRRPKIRIIDGKRPKEIDGGDPDTVKKNRGGKISPE